MGWSGRAPAPPAAKLARAPHEGARHVSDTQYRDRRIGIDIAELVPRQWARYARRHLAAAKCRVASGGAARQYTACLIGMEACVGAIT